MAGFAPTQSKQREAAFSRAKAIQNACVKCILAWVKAAEINKVPDEECRMIDTVDHPVDRFAFTAWPTGTQRCVACEKVNADCHQVCWSILVCFGVLCG